MIYFLLGVKQPIRIVLVLLYICCIVALSLLPVQDLPKVPLFPGADKMIHFMMYFIFSLLSCWALKTEEHFYRLFLIVLLTVGWGILMEYIQLAMHMGRNFSWYDVVANSIGVLIGILIYMLVAKDSEVL
jgi:VanZ family protein